MTILNRAAAAVVVAVMTASLAACGDDDVFQSDSDAGSGEGSGDLTVGGANFTEMVIMQEMYAALLEDAGYSVDIQSVEAREIYEPALESGEVDIVPEYAATFAEFLNAKLNGPDAPESAPVATTDPQETVEAARPLAEQVGLRLLDPAQAANQNGFVVTQEFAEANDLTTLSDLAALGEPVTLAAVEECPDRPFCQPGLENTYGLTITEVLPLGFGTPQTKEAVRDGDAQLGLVGTTDATLEDFGLVLLEDDKGLQRADNLVPVVNAESAGDDTIAGTLGELSDVLTTEDLSRLIRQVDSERQQAADVAMAYLEEKELL